MANRLPNDTWRIRTTLIDHLCSACDVVPYPNATINTLIPGQTAEIRPKDKPRAEVTDITLSFAGIKQQTVTLSGGGTTLETGLCVLNIAHTCTKDPNADREKVYATFGSVSTRLPEAGSYLPMTTGSGTEITDYNLPSGVESKIQITKQPEVQSMYVHDGRLYLPIMIEYRATTSET